MDETTSKEKHLLAIARKKKEITAVDGMKVFATREYTLKALKRLAMKGFLRCDFRGFYTPTKKCFDSC